MREGLSWVEDPSNENEDFTRIRARNDLSVKPDLTAKLLELQAQNRSRLEDERRLLGTWLSRHGRIDPQGFVTLQRVPPTELLLHLLRAISGTGGPIDEAKREALCDAMNQPDFKAATLAGAWVTKIEDGYLITRDMAAVKPRAGETAALGAPILLPKGEAYLWDGRFWLTAKRDDIYVRPAFGDIERLAKSRETQDLMSLPPDVRPTLPVFYKGERAFAFGVVQSPDLTAVACHSRRLEALLS